MARFETVLVRLSVEEKAAMVAASVVVGLPLSSWCRMRLISASKLTKLDREYDLDFVEAPKLKVKAEKNGASENVLDILSEPRT